MASKKVKPADRITGWRERREMAMTHARRRAVVDREFAAKYAAARMYA